jgi:indole-3-glycerol phosphate synthase
VNGFPRPRLQRHEGDQSDRLFIFSPLFFNVSILDKIIDQKKQEVAQAKAQVSLAALEQSTYFGRTAHSLKGRLLAASAWGFSPSQTGIIAEFKRKSPSKGIINDQVTVAQVTQGYALAGAAGLSVLTDGVFFGGSYQDLQAARVANPDTPILRKDFMIDTYQLWEAKAWGADVVLLIAANLSPSQVAELAQTAHALGLETLLEVHDAAELASHFCAHIDVVGVNNRNLRNFAENNINASLNLAELMPAGVAKISESCIGDTSTVQQLRAAGYDGFLIGESFMKHPEPGAAMQHFVAGLHR